MTPDSTIFQKVRNLVSLRLLFCVVLLTATIFLNICRSPSPPLFYLYLLIGGIFLLSLIYAVCLRRGEISPRFIFIQTAIDTVIVTAILLLTGSSNSIFSFLYLIVIVYSSMLLYRNGSLIMAALSAVQYAGVVMVDMAGYAPMGFLGIIPSNRADDWALAMYKVAFTSVACFAVSWLSRMLAEQSQKNRLRLMHIEEQVRRVEKMAMMGEMAAGLAHEIKNPLASLAGAIQMLESDLDLKSDQARLMRIVLRETERLTALLDSYLIFSKPQAGKIERIALGKAVEETQNMVRKNSRFKGNVHIEWRIPEEIRVEMDPAHLRQILWNLLLNAAESKPADCHVDIRAETVRDKWVRIRVEDNGNGIAQAHLSAVFDPFFTTKPHGTGLGLSIVHRIVISYHGRIDVESTPGKGTTFILSLPHSPGR